MRLCISIWNSIATSATPLRFPGKVLADAASDRLFIADSGHNRVVIATLDGKLLDTVGTGAAGHTDGPFDDGDVLEPAGTGGA